MEIMCDKLANSQDILPITFRILKKLIVFIQRPEKFPWKFPILILRRFLKTNNNTRSECKMFSLYSKWVTLANLKMKGKKSLYYLTPLRDA